MPAKTLTYNTRRQIAHGLAIASSVYQEARAISREARCHYCAGFDLLHAICRVKPAPCDCDACYIAGPGACLICADKQSCHCRDCPCGADCNPHATPEGCEGCGCVCQELGCECAYSIALHIREVSCDDCDCPIHQDMAQDCECPLHGEPMPQATIRRFGSRGQHVAISWD